MDVFDRDFDLTQFWDAYWNWLWKGAETRPVNEEIERVYRQMIRHTPKRCPHGKTALTCGDCYFDGWGRKDT